MDTETTLSIMCWWDPENCPTTVFFFEDPVVLWLREFSTWGPGLLTAIAFFLWGRRGAALGLMAALLSPTVLALALWLWKGVGIGVIGHILSPTTYALLCWALGLGLGYLARRLVRRTGPA